MNQAVANYDEPWKQAIGDYFDSFLNFFFPDVYQLIDWQQKPVSLEQELPKITIDSKPQKRFVDKLFKVWLKNSQEAWILIHVEVQSQYDLDFAQRMFIYYYRTFDMYNKPVISLAILGDERQSWRPSNYIYNLGGCEISLKFPMVKLLDYETKWHQLENETNPFAIIVMAHLRTKSTSQNLSAREEWKWLLIKQLYQKGYSPTEIIKLFKFIDLMMTLPKQLQKKLNLKIKNYEEEKKMPLLSNMEKMAIEEGKRKTLQENIMTLLHNRFDNVPSDLTNKINLIEDLEKLQNLFVTAIKVNSLTEIQLILDN